MTLENRTGEDLLMAVGSVNGEFYCAENVPPFKTITCCADWLPDVRYLFCYMDKEMMQPVCIQFTIGKDEMWTLDDSEVDIFVEPQNRGEA